MTTPLAEIFYGVCRIFESSEPDDVGSERLTQNRRRRQQSYTKADLLKVCYTSIRCILCSSYKRVADFEYIDKHKCEPGFAKPVYATRKAIHDCFHYLLDFTGCSPRKAR